MALIQIIYTSTATHVMSDADLDSIIASATRHNADNGITGMLLYADGQFMQMLEGEEHEVDATFARVAADPRHRDVTVTERSTIDTRSFANWSMGLRRLPEMPHVTAASGTGARGLAAALLGELARETP